MKQATDDHSQGQKKIFFPNLDGLRFFAFLAVFFAHTFYSNYEHIVQLETYQIIRFFGKHGALGVNLFFVLSGFLITYLLIAEKNKNGRIGVGSFYMRRILRIWPLYYSVVFIGFVLFPMAQSLMGKEVTESSNIYYYLFFFSNYSPVEPESAVLGILWSIAVEEQFYLIWPLLLAIFPMKYYKWVFATVILLSLFFRSFILQDIYSNSLACMSDLAIGSWLALLAYTGSSLIGKIQNLNRWVIIAIYLVGFVLIFTTNWWAEFSDLLARNKRLFYALFFAFIIAEQNYAKESIIKLGRFKLLSKLGTYTYGLYMLHFVAIYIVYKALTSLELNTSIYQVLIFEPVLALALSIVIAYLSFKLLELPFLNLKKQFTKVAKSHL